MAETVPLATSKVDPGHWTECERDMISKPSGSLVTGSTLVTKGNGAAVHLAYVYPQGGLATLCDRWGNTGAYGSRIRVTTASSPTCKSCMKHAEKLGMS